MFNETLLLICLKCNQIPKILYNTSEQVMIKCLCGYEKTLSLNDYYQQLSNNQEKIEISNKCSTHEGQSFEYYCINCKVNFCCQCKEKHQEHQTVLMKVPFKIKKLQEELTTIINNREKALLESKRIEIDKLTKQIKEIEIYYQHLVDEIKLNSSFIQSLINNYIQYGLNYNCISNLLSNCHFNQCSIDPIVNNEQTFVNYWKSTPMIEKCCFSEEYMDKIFLNVDKQLKENYELLLIDQSNGGKGIYLGESKDNKRDGKGMIFYHNNDKFKGQWKDDKKEGNGIYYFSNGDKYDGEWKDDKQNGKGVYYSKGNKFDGMWRNGKQDGNGVIYYKDGSKSEGIWKEGVKIK